MYISPKPNQFKVVEQIKPRLVRMHIPEIFNSFDVEANLTKEKKIPKPKKLESISSVSATDLNRVKATIGKSHHFTVDKLLSKSEIKAYPRTDRSHFDISSYSLHNKWTQIFIQNSELLNKTNIKKLESLRNAIDLMKQSIFSNLNLNDITKLTIFDSVFLVFSQFHEACQEVKNAQSQLQEEIYKAKAETMIYKDQVADLKEKIDKKKDKTSSNKALDDKFNTKIHDVQKKNNIEKIRLLANLALLEEHCKQLKKSNKAEENNADLERYKRLYEDSMVKIEKLRHKKKNMKYRFQLEIGKLKTKNTEDSEFRNEYSAKMTECLEKIEILEGENTEFKLGERKWIDRIKMLTEDFSRYVAYRELYNQVNESLRSLKLKYNHLELELIAGSISRKSDTITWISTQDPIFDKVRIGTVYPDLIYPIDFQNTSEFHLYSPTFSAYLDLPNDRFAIEPQFPNWLEVNIRGIYDSKYYEHLCCSIETGKTPARFSDFVYTWIGKYCIDEKTHTVTELEWWKKDAIGTLRVKFLSALKVENTRKVWEIFTFQEFLNDELMLDELAFYLHCRSLMFKGPQLAHTHGKFSSFHYIDREYINEVIDSVMHKLTAKERLDLKNQLYSRSKPMGKGTGIESGFVIST